MGSAETGGVIDLLRRYTFPRGLLAAVLFVLAAVVKLPAVVLAVVVHALERTSERALQVAESIPPQPSRNRPRTTTSK